ncbi:MAG TPA: anthranilate synthase component I family protein [Aquifex aeolicus]|uniref:Anthranilate synthase component I family protein n=1 Tax=Aquifex aeolicus TaxID=63363 RepID=A0A9D0YMZ4_AQUAO|nr:anthranilate synthase component I family protein [Aquifex sp.]HIP97950.1 anthranilate synthase component I family protein [Aquifex aeolicus]HIQ26179.1 anthranilate synthase component I family protein [Aquifex aeolicus]
MNLLILEKGFLGKRRTYEVEKVFYPQTWKEFFSTLENLRGETLFFYISFESGYELLKVKASKGNQFPPFLVASLKEKRLEFGREDFNLTFEGASLTKEKYLQKLEEIKGFIERGDIYQVNFTVRFDFKLKGSPLGLYLRFIENQEVPYGVFLKVEDLTVISGSMELFLRKEGKKLISKPIKGTLSKDQDPQKFFEMEKELAENLMITDMVRNDLGRVALSGSVKVEKLFGVESYKTLHQLVSTVSCETDKGFGEIVKATFPPASVTGAPKKRALEIINLLEPHTREVYCGTLGVLKPNGDFTCNVAIRTAIGKGEKLSYYAGGGIVWDSIPQREWEEVNLKAKAFISCLDHGTFPQR